LRLCLVWRSGSWVATRGRRRESGRLLAATAQAAPILEWVAESRPARVALEDLPRGAEAVSLRVAEAVSLRVVPAVLVRVVQAVLVRVAQAVALKVVLAVPVREA
jgi:hypothetical protein